MPNRPQAIEMPQEKAVDLNSIDEILRRNLIEFDKQVAYRLENVQQNLMKSFENATNRGSSASIPSGKPGMVSFIHLNAHSNTILNLLVFVHSELPREVLHGSTKPH